MSFDTPAPPFTASDPYATFVNTSCLDLLLIELVPLAERIARRHEHVDDPIPTKRMLAGNASTAGGVATEKDDDGDAVREAIYFRLESLGYRVGQGLSERFSRDRPRFTDDLDVIKFLCKDLWIIVFKKQIDNLKTNHRGVYVLTDNMFRPFSRMSMANRSETVMKAQSHLYFPSGIIRGALASLGLNATVQAEAHELPQAIFQIKALPAKA